MNTNDIRSQRIYEALETLPLSQEELERAEAYVLGEEIEGMEQGSEESEILEQFSFRDLSKIPSDKIVRLFHDFSKRSRNEETIRLFQLLFAIGQSTMSQLIPMNMIAYRSQYGSVNPAGIVGPAMVATMVSTVVAIVFCKIINRK